MKQIIFILFFLIVIKAKGQTDNGCISYLRVTTRPDTVKSYLFTDTSIFASKIPKVKPISNFGFKTHYFTLNWAPIVSTDIKHFIDRTLKDIPIIKIMDTVNIKILNSDYLAIVLKTKNEIKIIMYQNKSRYQDIFLMTTRKKNKLQQVLNFISTYLNH